MTREKLKNAPVTPTRQIILLAAGILIGAGVMFAGFSLAGQTKPESTPAYESQNVPPVATVMSTRIWDAALSPEGKAMLVFADGRLLHYELQPVHHSGGILQSHLKERIDNIKPGKMVFSPSGDTVAIMSAEGVTLYEMPAMTLIHEFPGYSQAVFTPDEQHFLLLNRRSEIHLVNTGSLEIIDRLEYPSASIDLMQVSPDGQSLAITIFERDAEKKVLRLLPLSDLHTATPREYPVRAAETDLVFHPYGQYVAIGYEDGSVIVYDLDSSTQQQFQLPQPGIVRMHFSPDGKWLVASPYDMFAPGVIYSWRWQTPETLMPDETWNDFHEMKGHLLAITAIALTWDGQYLLTGSMDGSLRVWDYQDTFTQISHLQL